MRICIYGAGAIGGWLGVQLSLAGEDVTLIARGPHLDAMQKNLTIVLIVMVVITIIAALVGYLLGKAFQTKQEALKHTG